MAEVQLVKIGAIDPSIPEILAVLLRDSLSLECAVLDPTIDPVPAYDPKRDQYDSAVLLGELARLPRRSQSQREKVLGVADVDLFIPILTFVFGQAQLRNRAAILSTHRLRQEVYGLPPDRALLLRRCEKEAIHELGHTFGLVHCRKHDCAMHYSNSVEEVDLKSNALCDECTRLFAAAIR